MGRKLGGSLGRLSGLGVGRGVGGELPASKIGDRAAKKEKEEKRIERHAQTQTRTCGAYGAYNKGQAKKSKAGAGSSERLDLGGGVREVGV